MVNGVDLYARKDAEIRASQPVQLDQVSIKGATVPHLTISVDKLKTTPPPSTDLRGSSSGTASVAAPFTPNHTVVNNNLIATSGIAELYREGPFAE